MKKIFYVLGTRSGGCWEMQFGSKEQGEELIHLAATNASKQDLYKVYDFIESQIVKTLAVLTSTGKTKIVLVKDNFVEKVKEFTQSLQHCVVWY